MNFKEFPPRFQMVRAVFAEDCASTQSCSWSDCAALKKEQKGACTAPGHDLRAQKLPKHANRQRRTNFLGSWHERQPLTGHVPAASHTANLAVLDANVGGPVGPIVLPLLSEKASCPACTFAGAETPRRPLRPQGRSSLQPLRHPAQLQPLPKHKRTAEEKRKQAWKAKDVQAQPPHPDKTWDVWGCMVCITMI